VRGIIFRAFQKEGLVLAAVCKPPTLVNVFSSAAVFVFSFYVFAAPVLQFTPAAALILFSLYLQRPGF